MEELRYTKIYNIYCNIGAAKKIKMEISQLVVSKGTDNHS